MGNPDMRLVPVDARDLDALRYVLNRADDFSRIRTVMSTFTLPERETTADRLERLYAVLKSAAPHQPQPARSNVTGMRVGADALTPHAESYGHEYSPDGRGSCSHCGRPRDEGDPRRCPSHPEYAVYLEEQAALRAQQPAQGEAVAIVPFGCTGTSLAFDPGVLHVSKDGSGYIAIDEAHFELEDDRAEGPDGPEGSVHWITRLDASEVVALRDFLIGAASSQQPADDKLKEAADALEPLARLELPKKPVGNAGAYSILHTDIRRAKEALAALKTEAAS